MAKKKIDVGSTVTWTRRNGLPAKGKVVKVDTAAPSGKWLHVDTATKGQAPAISRVRPGVLNKKA
jgi:hypothetical protein